MHGRVYAAASAGVRYLRHLNAVLFSGTVTIGAHACGTDLLADDVSDVSADLLRARSVFCMLLLDRK